MNRLQRYLPFSALKLMYSSLILSHLQFDITSWGFQWDQWEPYNQDYIGGPMRWGTNESCVIRVALGDQWDGRPMRTLHWGTNEMGDQWELYSQGYLHRGTNEMGDQWEQGRKGNTGGPMRWETNENKVERVTLGDQWDGGPMRTV